MNKNRLKATILDILNVYSDCLGGVPLKMLEFHIHHHPRMPVEEYSREELGEALSELLHEKRINRDVIAYKLEGE